VRSGFQPDLTQLTGRQVSAIAPGKWRIRPVEIPRDSQGSLPKIATNAYHDENATEL
jgi:hypothetical protein